MNQPSLPAGLLATAVAIAAVDPDRLGSAAGAQPAALALVGFTAAIVSIHQHGFPRRTAALTWLVAWLGWAAVGAVLSPNPGTALLSVASFAAVGITAANLAVGSSAADMARLLGMAGLLSLALAVAVAAAGGNGGVSGRFQLLFLEPNQLARATALILIGIATAWISQVAGPRDPVAVAVLTAAGVVSAGALFLTESRTGVAAAAVGVLVVLTSQISRRLSVAALAATGLLLASGALAVLSGNAGESINQSLSRSTSAPTDELRTLNGRTVLWPEVVSVAMERPVTGVGLGLDRDLVSRFRAEGRVVWSAEHTHSLPLQLWLTTGIPGLILAGAAVVTAGRRAWRGNESAERSLALGLLAVILVDGIVEPVLRVPSFGWVALAAAASLAYRSESIT